MSPSERDEIIALVTRLQEQNAELMAANEELRRQLAESHRSGRRQAAPFSKGRRSGKPKRPGRKPGTGLFSYRKPPSADEVTEPVVEVPVSGDTCPGCGGRLDDEGVNVAYVTDIPPIRRPQVRAYRVQVCRCRSCGRAVRGEHPEVAADQYGASAHRVTLGCEPMRSTMGWAFRYGGFPLSDRGGSEPRSAQDALRRAKGRWVMPPNKLRTSRASARSVHTDDTGWRVGGDGSVSDHLRRMRRTVYQVRALTGTKKCARWFPRTTQE